MENAVVVRKVTLSDGSHVFNVELHAIDFDAVTRKDAFALAQKLIAAAQDHANTELSLVDRT